MVQVLFGSVRSYDDLGLILTDVDIPVPEPKRTVVEVPGRDGVLDLTGALTSTVRYKNRKIKLTFTMADYQKRWISLFSEIVTQLHGRWFEAAISSDSGYYWDAFCTVDQAKCDRNKGTVVVALDAHPYKYRQTSTEYTVIPATVGKLVTCSNSRMPVVPEFYATGSGVSVSFGDITHTLAASETESFPDIVFEEGDNELIITGSAAYTVTVRYREGKL